MKQTLFVTAMLFSILFSIGQDPYVNNEFGKQFVIDGREILAFDKAREKLKTLKPPMERALDRYWIGISENNSDYIFFFYAKPERGSKPSEWPSVRGNEYLVKVNKRTLEAGPFTRSQ